MNNKISRMGIAILIVCFPIIAAQAAALSTNAVWVWMKGANITNQNGTYGTQGVPAATNTPGGRYGAAAWRDAAGAALWLFGGLGFPAVGISGRLNDLWKYDPATTNWTWMKGSTNRHESGTYGTRGVPDPANTPGARDYPITWTDDAGALWLFGGCGYDASGSLGELNDLWKFDPATTNWTWIKGSTNCDQNGIYGTQGVPAATNTPGGRDSAAAWMDGTGALWVFSGFGYDASGNMDALNDLWKFDPATTNWTWIKGSTNIAQKGTYGTRGVPAQANTPGARYYAATWTDTNSALWLFGGFGYDAPGNLGDLNDLWKYDPATTNWTWAKGATNNNEFGTYGMRGMPDPANTPGGRISMVSWVDSTGALWLFGGLGYSASGTSGQLNDLWKYDPATTNWTWIKGADFTNQPGTYGMRGVPAPTNTPGGRDSMVSWVDSTGALWLFGGLGYSASGTSGQLNDLWKFNIFGGISLATQALNFSAVFQNTNPAAQVIGMTNIGRSAFTCTNVITYDTGASGWLAVLPNTCTINLNGATVLTNQVNITGLNAGTYYATNLVIADATNSPKTVVITLTVNKADQAITFPSIPDQMVTNQVDLAATASSGLPVGFAVISGPAALSYQNTLALTGTGRVVVAASQSGNSNWNAAPGVTNSFNVTSVTSGPSPSLSAPTNVTASDGRYAGKVALSWSAVSGSAGYTVWRHTTDDSSAASLLGTIADTHYADTSASGGTLYYYWVKATNDTSTSAFSSPDSGWRRSSGYTHYADVDIDGDRKADLVIFDPITGTWRAKLSASGYAEASGVFGDTASTLVPGDYDGDLKTDLGVYAELTGLWTLMLSSMGYGQASATLGGMGYAPTPGDFDGDFKTDLGVYQAASGGWTVKLSASGYAETGTTFGGPDYLPVQRDYDGDAKADPAIYQLANGEWRVLLSGSGYGEASAPGFGGTGYAPVVGDYDADGKADPAIYHESTGLWTVMLSGSGYLIAYGTLGGTGYAALPGDYDGDGKTDPAVYNTATGEWLVMLSGSGYGIATATFGGAGYDPVGLKP